MKKQIIAVIGGTGAQGGGVVDALLSSGQFEVRVASRNPASAAAQALEKRGVRVVKGDLIEPSSLRAAFEGAHGAFVVTNFWEPAQMQKEAEVGNTAVRQAREAGVEHLIWSTLPNVEKISGGALKVHHFTEKARVNATVEAAQFARHTFVEAPFYFQNLQTIMAPQQLPNGARGWAVPIDPSARVIHAGDVRDVGRAVAAAFAAGDALANGSTLAVCGGVYSWNDFASVLNAQGQAVQVQQVPAAAYDTFFTGAAELREMFEYFAKYTYFGPERELHIAAANRLVPAGFVGFSQWAKANLVVSAR